MKYTLGYFEQLKACKPALDWFKKTFPKGATLTEIEAVIPDKDWLGWLAAALLDISLAERERLAAKSYNPKGWYGCIAIEVLDIPLADRERLAAKSNDPKYYYWCIAIYIPDIALTDRERLVAKSNDPKGWLDVIRGKWGVE